MNNKLIALLIILIISPFISKAETVTYKSFLNGKHDYTSPHYLGMDDEYYYFRTGTYEVTRYGIRNPEKTETYKIDMVNTASSWASYYLYKSNIYVVTNQSEEIVNESSFAKIRIGIYKFNSNNGKFIKKMLFERKDSSKNSYKYSHNMDTITNRFYIEKSGDVVSSYDFEFEETEDFKPSKIKSKPQPAFDFLEEFNYIFSGLNIKGLNITINGAGSTDKYTKFMDSTHLDYYDISFEKKKDEDIYSFNRELLGITIASKNKANKVKSVEMDFDADKNVFDINYREDKSGNLYIFGKYIIKGSSKDRYGVWSSIYDKELTQKTPIKYNELNSIDRIDKVVPYGKFIGFIFMKLYNMDYEFYIPEEDMFIFTYQKRYSNVQDHIYIMKMDKNGEITMNWLVSRLNNEKLKYGNEKHMALLAGSRIHFLFYDHIDNIGKKNFDEYVTVGNVEKKNIVLAQATYNIDDDDFSVKKLIADKKTLKYLPHLEDPIIHFDSQLNQYVCLLEATKKNKTVMYYQFFYTE